METGDVIWSYDFRETVGQATFHGDPLLAGDLVITGTESLTPVAMRAFDRHSGRVVWAREGEWALTRSDVIGVDGLAVGRNDRAELVALDATSGDLVWHVPHEGQRFRPDVAESPAVWRSTVVFSAPDGRLYQVDAATGTVGWRVSLGCDVSTSVSIAGDDVYVGCGDGRLFHVAAPSGEVLATHSLNRALEGRLVVLDDRVVVPGGRTWIGAVDRALSQVLWSRTDLPRLSVVQPILWRGVLLTGTGDGELLALSPADGQTEWTVQLEGSLRGLGYSDAILLVGTIQGAVYALRPGP